MKPARRPSPRRVPLPVRVARAARAGLHVVAGIVTTYTVFPFVAPPRRREIVRRWSARLLRILRVEARVHGMPEGGLAGNLLIVANHVSWLDIFVLLALQPARFVGKAEIRRWPVVGRLSANAGTLFVERERRRHAHSINREAASALARGDIVAIFPEGTTTDGTTLLPFKSSLLQPIVDAEGHVQPVALRYRNAEGAPSDAPAYVGDTTFVASFWRVTAEPALVAEAHVGVALPARARRRRELAREAEDVIRTALGSPASGSAPGRRGDRRA
ncbi:MAG TPA: lysophospholipid acyltransferase family protein [Casimicrobiaceae bacterium]|nr:lysophospholipid acyltransferase family protein [Casimicrobiaceae bacterium]